MKLKDLIELISLSKIPVINAIVPPDTPGITFAAPIPNPLRKRIIYLIIENILNNNLVSGLQI